MKRVEFSKAAIADQDSIIAYTVEHFGIKQARRLRANRLRANFERTLDALAANPNIGHTREDLDPEGRSFRYLVTMNLFIVVYQLTEDSIQIVRILHGMRNLAAEIERDTGSTQNETP